MTSNGSGGAPPLEAAARDLRDVARVSRRRPRDIPLRAHFAALEEWVPRVRARLQAGTSAPLEKVADWFLDNDYVIESALRSVRSDLPSGFYARLPAREGGEASGLPRAFTMARALLVASRLQLSLDGAVRFANAYQEDDEALTIAELWAFPALLRIACLELLVSSLARLLPEVPPPSAVVVPPATDGFDDTDRIARAIANLRIVDAIAWKDFFQRVSRVERVLRSDPAGFYGVMDFETRDRYRHRVEELAQGCGCPEERIAQRVVEQALAHRGRPDDVDHIGHWLIGDGAAELERALDCRPALGTRLRAALRARAGAIYASALVLSTLAAVLLPDLVLEAAGARPLERLVGVVVAVLPASFVSLGLVHWLITLIVRPVPLPKLDFQAGIPDDCRTLVAVPALVASESAARELVVRLEEHYLANLDPALDFALLTDWADSSQEEAPGDAAVLAELCDGIRALNSRWAGGGPGPFHLLHRKRRFNPREGCWMGWERKRGKLEELNHLLAGEPSEAFAVREGDSARFAGIRFVITLDADTVLPPGAAQRLVGTLAHPLNTARFDGASGRVARGYTVIQPRVEVSPQAGNRTAFSRLYAGDTAIDIYTHAVSDVYQDLFGSGSFIGKGIYEVASFRRSLEGRVPEDALASHDLFEGAHGRTGLASDIVLYESFPRRYEAYARRSHRWVRGDWQLLPWLGRRVPAAGGRTLPNRLTWLDRWKIVDNLRRSLLPASLVVMLVAGWLALPGNVFVWTALGLLAPAAAIFIELATSVARSRRRGAVRGALLAALNHAGHWFLAVTFLANDARVALDAIVRTLWRTRVSRKRLLQWTAAADVETELAGAARRAAWRALASAPAFALALAAAIAFVRPSALPAAAPLLLLWAAAPEIAFQLGRERGARKEMLSPADAAWLRKIARRTWLYFETFVSPENHWLPPDNLQEHPHRALAPRTSPTNVGMALLSTVTAADLGYLGLAELDARMRNSLDSLGHLARHRGHLLNWYDTRTLAPLEPRYVSTVDSGNLAVSLVTVSESLRELAQGPALAPQAWLGLRDALALLADALARIPHEASGELEKRACSLAERAAEVAGNEKLVALALARLCGDDLVQLERSLAGSLDYSSLSAAQLRELHTWLERALHQAAAMRRDSERLAPWLGLLEDPPPERSELARELAGLLPPSLPLQRIPERCERALRAVDAAAREVRDAPIASWDAQLRDALARAGKEAGALAESLLRSAERCSALAWGMDFRLLYDADARRFRIGYNASADRFDANHYDLLASEARLASFFAIAKADVPPEHWFHLGRPLHRVAGRLTLVSWGGSMFEYLMPPLFLRSESGTLLAQSERNAIGAQRRWARKLGIPWGASESAFASFDPGGSYRYQSFGVPGLGLRRGLARDRVVAPYASALALPIRPSAALRNLRALESLGLVGPYGFVDSADFTPERLGSGRRFTPVMTFMAHHQGMILAALDNALCGDALVRRFHADLRIRTAELLLHERIPHEAPATFEREEPPAELPRTSAPLPPAWTPAGVHGAPRIHTLGNGRLASWTSAAGAGALRWEGLAVTRWRPDATRDASGLWIYLRDAQSGEIWSVGRQPTGRGAGDARATFHPHLVELHRREHGIATRLDVAVAHGDDVEIRRVTLANESGAPRELIVTSYAEVALAPPLDDERHPAFSKLFVRTEWLPSQHGLLFKRRPRRAGEPSITAFHGLVSDDAGVEIVGHEADRAAFLGRGGSARSPLGVSRGLTGTTGFTLDPVMAIQARVVLEPYGRARLAFLTFAGGSRESVLETASRYETLASLEWAIADAGGGVARELQRLAIPGDALPQLQAVGSLLLAPSRSLGASAAQRAANLLGQTQLWGHGISGDLPILLLRLADPVKTELMDLLVRGLAYWRQRGIETDLVIVRSGPSSYAEPLRERLHALLRETGASAGLGRRGGVHLVFTDQTHADEIRLLACCARVVLDDARGTLAEQLAAVPAPPPAPPPFPRAAAPAPTEAAVLERPRNLAFDNGLGGFSPDGREYVIHLEPGRTTPAPWSNVLANERFGCLVTESGGGFTWSINSGENRLTACSNDPVADPPSEALLLRDEETGGVFSITPRPAGDGAACQIRHGAGTTSWRRISHGLDQTLCVFVAHDAPVKIARVELQNRTARPRRLTATYWAEWLLGSLESASRSHVVCSWDARAPALLARNPWNADFAARVAFLSATLPPHGVSADRREFLGPEGDLASPAALERWGLSGRVDPGADPGAAYQVHLDIPPDGRVCFSFVLGQGGDRAEALALATEWRDPARIERARAALGEHWDRLLGAVQVHTPDAALDLLVNRWLLYQVVSSRLYARAGFYQANGAFGFRDQLQDTLALLHVEPRRVRAHLLLCAAHQFEQGDVLHWWHPPADRGVRTRCSDDLLWLPYAVSCYVEATGDAAVLDERVRFLQAPELAPLEHDRYSRFEPGAEATLFEHCRRALERGVTSGRHGLPRIGSGDWNDGFDRVGARGDGESVWLGWFAFDVMNRFAALCERRGERELATHWRARASALGASLAAVAWDGAWWLRAFDDDGRPLGSHANTECRIDSVSQSWAVLSGARQDARAREALASAQRELVQGAPPLVRLFWPPFHASPRDPGYVKVYPPGIRENGGQYNHAAAWLAWACAEIGDTRSAAELLAAINPILRSAASCERYRVEPYVLAGDVSSCEPHTGRGGWTWYTGSAAWAWRLVVEQLLGIRRRDGAVMLRPRLPSGWDRFEAVVRGARGALRVRVRTDDVPAPELTVDGEPLAADAAIPLPTAELERKVDLRIPRALPAGDDDSTSA